VVLGSIRVGTVDLDLEFALRAAPVAAVQIDARNKPP
jgi:hypothetical protein